MFAAEISSQFPRRPMYLAEKNNAKGIQTSCAAEVVTRGSLHSHQIKVVLNVHYLVDLLSSLPWVDDDRALSRVVPLSRLFPMSSTSKRGSSSRPCMLPSAGPHDELTSTVFGAIQALPPTRKANFLLDTSLALIEAGQYGDDVESYLEVYLKTPNLPNQDVARALLARGMARKSAGDKLVAKAHQGLCATCKVADNTEIDFRFPSCAQLGPLQPGNTTSFPARKTGTLIDYCSHAFD